MGSRWSEGMYLSKVAIVPKLLCLPFQIHHFHLEYRLASLAAQSDIALTI